MPLRRKKGVGNATLTTYIIVIQRLFGAAALVPPLLGRTPIPHYCTQLLPRAAPKSREMELRQN